MLFAQEERKDWVHMRNEGNVAVWFQWDGKMYKISPNEVAHLPGYLADHLMSGGCTNYAPNAGVDDRPANLLRRIDPREGSVEFLKSEARRKQAAAEEAADAARKAAIEAEKAKADAGMAAGVARAAVENIGKKGGAAKD